MMHNVYYTMYYSNIVHLSDLQKRCWVFFRCDFLRSCYKSFRQAKETFEVIRIKKKSRRIIVCNTLQSALSTNRHNWSSSSINRVQCSVAAAATVRRRACHAAGIRLDEHRRRARGRASRQVALGARRGTSSSFQLDIHRKHVQLLLTQKSSLL